MNAYLLDTFACIFALVHPHLLGTEARELVEHPDGFVFFSPVNVWEIEIKAATGKLAAPAGDVPEALTSLGFTELLVTSRHAERAGRLPLLHRDPFDRMLVAQALEEGMVLVTPDHALSQYELPTLAC